MSKNIKTKFRNNALISIVAVIAVVVLLNILAYELFARFDLTQNKNFSLTSASKEVVKSLDEKVVINIYFSKQLPPEYLTVRQSVEDLLEEYKNYAGSNLKINYIDPKDDTDLKQELRVKGIPELQFNILEKDQFQLTTGYLGMSINYLDKEEIIPVVESTSTFEYDLTSAIKKVTSDQEHKVAWFTTTQDTEKYSSTISELKESYQIINIDLAQSDLDNSYKTLIVVGIESEVGEDIKNKIDQFIVSGGSVLFLLDGIKVDLSLQAQPNATGLDDLLANYGITINKELVLDNSAEMASFSGGYMTFMVPYPFWVKVGKDNFAAEHAAVSELESLTLPWASNITIDSDDQVTEIIKSSNKAWLSGAEVDLNPQQSFTSNQYNQYTLGATITSGSHGRIAVIGDADFISSSFLGQFPTNYIFLANMLDWLNQDEALISIRSKGTTDRSLAELSDNQKSMIKYLNIFGITAVVIIIGLSRSLLRRKKTNRKIRFSLK